MITIIASYKTSYQISPDDWNTAIKTYICDENTTVYELLKWSNGVNINLSIPDNKNREFNECGIKGKVVL